jgi:hypothetical protein
VVLVAALVVVVTVVLVVVGAVEVSSSLQEIMSDAVPSTTNAAVKSYGFIYVSL